MKIQVGQVFQTKYRSSEGYQITVLSVSGGIVTARWVGYKFDKQIKDVLGDFEHAADRGKILPQKRLTLRR